MNAKSKTVLLLVFALIWWWLAGRVLAAPTPIDEGWHRWRINSKECIWISPDDQPTDYYVLDGELIQGHSTEYFPITMQIYTQDICSLYGVDYEVVVSVIYRESRFTPYIKNRTSTAYGYMQILQGHEGRLGVNDRTDVHKNILLGIKLMAESMSHYSYPKANPNVVSHLQLAEDSDIDWNFILN